MKKIFRLLAIALGVIIIACLIISLKETKFNSAVRFKKEYESLNGTVAKNGKVTRSINIEKNNPFVYKKENDIVSMMEKKESFIVYFGFASCPWCRSILPTILEVAKEQNIKKIYYVDVLNIRDKMAVDEDSKLKVETKGTDGYYRLLALLDNVLEDYTVEDKSGNKVSCGEKRIYAPNLIKIENGKAVKLTTGISDMQEDGYQELTDNMVNQMKEKILEVLK